MLSNLEDAPRIRLGFDQGNPSISVHDASATPRLEIFDADEIVGLRLRNATGQERVALFSTQDDSALQLNDATQVRAALVGAPDGSTLVLNDAQANPRTLLYFNEEVGSALDFLDEHGSNRAVFRTLDTGGALGFLDDQGTVRTTFAFADDGGVLAFFDEHETTRVSLTSSSDADELVFHDEHATERAVLASGPAGPALEIKDAQGTVRAELGFGASGGPGLDLRDAQGAMAATFSSSAAGRLLGLYDGENGRRMSFGHQRRRHRTHDLRRPGHLADSPGFPRGRSRTLARGRERGASCDRGLRPEHAGAHLPHARRRGQRDLEVRTSQ